MPKIRYQSLDPGELLLGECVCVCAWRRPRRHQLNWAVGSVHCAVHQGVRAPVCTTAAINRLQSSLALSACKSGAGVLVGVSWGLVLVQPHSHLHRDQALV